MIKITLRAPSGDARSPRGRIDAHSLHQGQVNDQSVIDAAEAGTIVGAAANGDRQIAGAAKIDGRDDVSHVDTARDQERALVNHTVVKLARFVVVRMTPSDDRAAQAFGEP